MTIRPYIAAGRRQARIGVCWHLRGEPAWRWHFKWLSVGWSR